ncbi:MAG: tetratricopeptide repeat protein [Verrucomicrobiae bacterium]|nr:tetratricopeptide repeat protein [Verrucomicrobiae bacterium]
MDVPREVRLLYERGVEALHRDNYEYAITLLKQALDRDPAFFDCRKALRQAQLAKASAKTGLLKKLVTTASTSPLLGKGQLALATDPLEAINIAEQILCTDPHNVHAHKLLGQAALAADMPQTAVLAFELAVKQSPRDKALVLEFAEALTKAGDQARAEKVLTELQRVYPNDVEVAQALKNVTAQRTLKEQGYEALASGTGSYRDILKDKEEAIALEQQQRIVKSEETLDKLIAEHEAQLNSAPNNLRILRALADLYTQRKRYDDALACYERIRAVEGASDPSLEKAIATLTVRKYDEQLARLDPNAPDYPQQAERLRAEKLAYQLDECRRRAERFPTDLTIKFELGQLYFESGRLNEAIQEFQKAQANPHLHIRALFYLGQCFARKGIYDLAARAFQNAIKEKLVFDDEKKELIYALGSVLEKMGKQAEAIEQFKLIYEQDISFKDVAAKIDAYYANR